MTEDRKAFYNSDEWKKLRYSVLQKHYRDFGHRCLCCKGGGPFHVDHIKPRSKYPELALDATNLQVLCESCNIGKSNLDETDFREEEKSPPKYISILQDKPGSINWHRVCKQISLAEPSLAEKLLEFNLVSVMGRNLRLEIPRYRRSIYDEINNEDSRITINFYLSKVLGPGHSAFVHLEDFISRGYQRKGMTHNPSPKKQTLSSEQKAGGE